MVVLRWLCGRCSGGCMLHHGVLLGYQQQCIGSSSVLFCFAVQYRIVHIQQTAEIDCFPPTRARFVHALQQHQHALEHRHGVSRTTLVIGMLFPYCGLTAVMRLNLIKPCRKPCAISGITSAPCATHKLINHLNRRTIHSQPPHEP